MSRWPLVQAKRVELPTCTCTCLMFIRSCIYTGTCVKVEIHVYLLARVHLLLDGVDTPDKG